MVGYVLMILISKGILMNLYKIKTNYYFPLPNDPEYLDNFSIYLSNNSDYIYDISSVDVILLMQHQLMDLKFFGYCAGLEDRRKDGILYEYYVDIAHKSKIYELSEVFELFKVGIRDALINGLFN